MYLTLPKCPPTGSSPREWGTHPRYPSFSSVPRFIPTRVGNTADESRRCWFDAVHPHASGEHFDRCTKPRTQPGSSPREWGTPRDMRLVQFVRRFIPTRVGNTTRPQSRPAPASVHPHASGEHNSACARPGGRDGSSPREWGTQPRHHPTETRSRFIPTRVGNTALRAAIRAAPSVHPHASGEHLFARDMRSSAFGSSPREWGTPNTMTSSQIKTRFIPTRVGNTNVA